MSVNGLDVMYASHQRVVDLVRLTKGAHLVLVVGASGKSPLSTPMPMHRDTNIDSGQIVPLMFSPDPQTSPRLRALPPVRETPAAPTPPPPPPVASPAVLSLAAARQTQGTTRRGSAPQPRPPPQHPVAALSDRPPATPALCAVLQGLGGVRLKRTSAPVVRTGAAVGRVLESGPGAASQAPHVPASPPQRRASGPAPLASTGGGDPLAGILSVKLKKTPGTTRKEYGSAAVRSAPSGTVTATSAARRVQSGPADNSHARKVGNNADTFPVSISAVAMSNPPTSPGTTAASDTEARRRGSRSRSVGPPVVKPKPPRVSPRRSPARPRTPPDLASLPPDFHAAYIVPHPRSVATDTAAGTSAGDPVMVPPPPPGFWASGAHAAPHPPAVSDTDTPHGHNNHASDDDHLFIPPPPMDFGHDAIADNALNSIDFLPPMPSPGPDDAPLSPSFDFVLPPPPAHVLLPAPLLAPDGGEETDSDGYMEVSVTPSPSPSPAQRAPKLQATAAAAMVQPGTMVQPGAPPITVHVGAGPSTTASAASSYSVASTSDSSESDSDEDLSGFDAVPGQTCAPRGVWRRTAVVALSLLCCHGHRTCSQACRKGCFLVLLSPSLSSPNSTACPAEL